MYEAAQARYAQTDVAILAAAVADYRPKSVATQKIKKKADDFSLQLERTTDIAASLGKIKRKNQLLIGFALETTNELENAKGKLQRKNFDFIVLNSLQEKGAGFQYDTNKVSIIFSDNKQLNFELKTKVAVAADILNEVVDLLSKMA